MVGNEVGPSVSSEMGPSLVRESPTSTYRMVFGPTIICIYSNRSRIKPLRNMMRLFPHAEEPNWISFEAPIHVTGSPI